MPLQRESQIKKIVSRIDYFTACFGQVKLRPYQVEAANAVIESILNKDGETFVWKFARQSGKDETLTALYQYILTILAHTDASIVAAAPTYKPQTGLAMQRLDRRLSRHIVLQKEWRRSFAQRLPRPPRAHPLPFRRAACQRRRRHRLAPAGDQ